MCAYISGGVAGSFLSGKALTEQFEGAPGSSDNTPQIINSMFSQLAHIQDFLTGILQVGLQHYSHLAQLGPNLLHVTRD